MSQHNFQHSPASRLTVFANHQARVALTGKLPASDSLVVAVKVNGNLVDDIARNGVNIGGEGVEVLAQPSFLNVSTRGSRSLQIDSDNPLASLEGQNVSLTLRKAKDGETPIEGRLVTAGTPGKHQTLTVQTESGSWSKYPMSEISGVKIEDSDLNQMIDIALDEQAEQRKNAGSAYVIVTLKIEQETDVTFEWRQPFDSWATTYSLQLGEGDNPATLEQKAVLSSSLGFDFTGSVLLSTREPGTATDEESVPESAMKLSMVETASFGGSPRLRSAGGPPRAKSPNVEVQVKADGIVEYPLEEVTLQDGRKQTPTIKPDLTAEALRELRYTGGKHPEITIRVKNTNESTLLGGPCEVFDHTGDYIGEGSLRTIAPSEEARVSVGDDKRIRVREAVRNSKEYSVVTEALQGLFLGRNVREKTKVLEIRNTDRRSVDLTVIVSKDHRQASPEVDTANGLELATDPVERRGGTELEYQVSLAPFESGADRQELLLTFRERSDVELRLESARDHVISFLKGSIVAGSGEKILEIEEIAEAIKLQGEISSLKQKFERLEARVEEAGEASRTYSDAIRALQTKPDAEVLPKYIAGQERALADFDSARDEVYEVLAEIDKLVGKQTELLTKFVLQGETTPAAIA